MAVKKTGLGKGLDSLIPVQKKSTKTGDKSSQKETAGKTGTAGKQGSRPETAAKSKEISNITDKDVKNGKAVLMVKITQVEPNRSQPRRKFDEDALLELSESIKQYGVLQPLLVQKKDGYYEIIAGERRWRAAKLAGVKEVPVIVKDFSDQEVVEISLIENIQREDLNAIEEAQAYQRLLKEFHLKQDEVAERVSKSRTTVTNSLRLLKLDERVQQMVIDEMISTGHARTLLGLPDGNLQYKLAQQIFDEKLSVREVEKMVRSLVNGKPVKEKPPVNEQEEVIYHNLEEKMKAYLGTQVSIKRKDHQRGRIEIDYYTHEDLERLLYLFQRSQEPTRS